MEGDRTRERLWRFLCAAVRPVLRRRFALDMEPLPEERPVILVCNHVTDMDPVLLAMASPKHPLTYVASGHILRDRPLLRKLLYLCFAPIPRRKAASAVDTCRKTVRAVREGKTVCVFAEGETTWNGRTAPIQAGTGTLVKAAGVPLVTYRFHGSYFAAPRWGKAKRRGKISGRVTGFRTAEELKGMTAEQVNGLIREGIREDAFEEQKKERVPVRARGGRMLEGIETLLFLCPECRGVGTLRGRGKTISCGCGLEVRTDGCMLPEGESPFPDFSAWDDWQAEALAETARKDPSFQLDEGRDDLALYAIDEGDTAREAARGNLSMDREGMRVGDFTLPRAEIRDMATLQTRKLAVAAESGYYELRAPEALCLRKYLLLWRALRDAEEGAGEEK